MCVPVTVTCEWSLQPQFLRLLRRSVKQHYKKACEVLWIISSLEGGMHCLTVCSRAPLAHADCSGAESKAPAVHRQGSQELFPPRVLWWASCCRRAITHKRCVKARPRSIAISAGGPPTAVRPVPIRVLSVSKSNSAGAELMAGRWHLMLHAWRFLVPVWLMAYDGMQGSGWRSCGGILRQRSLWSGPTPRRPLRPQSLFRQRGSAC